MKTTNGNRIKINFHTSRSRNARPKDRKSSFIPRNSGGFSPEKRPTDKAYPLPTYPIPQVNARFRLYNPSASLKPERESGKEIKRVNQILRRIKRKAEKEQKNQLSKAKTIIKRKIG